MAEPSSIATASPPPATNSHADEEDEISSLNVDGLTIDENKKPRPNLAEDPNIEAITSGDTVYTSTATFEDLSLSPELLKGIYVEMRFQKPSKIQAVTLPMILSPPYRDLIAQGHNGSGKTTCFVLGMLSRVDPNLPGLQALCICPTRELAIQNNEVLRKMGKYIGINFSEGCAVRMAKEPPITTQVVIGSGYWDSVTVKKWISPKKLGVTRLKIVVFDEADHMLAEVNLVVNYDLPVKHTAEYTCEPEPDYEVYLHRGGRAGRFGRKGAVFNLICDERDEKLMSKIENHFGTHVTEVREKSVEDYKGALKKAGLLE